MTTEMLLDILGLICFGAVIWIVNRHNDKLLFQIRAYQQLLEMSRRNDCRDPETGRFKRKD